LSGLKQTGSKNPHSKRMPHFNKIKKIIDFQKDLSLFGSNFSQIPELSPLKIQVLEKEGENRVTRANNIPKEMDKMISNIRSKSAKAPSWRA